MRVARWYNNSDIRIEEDPTPEPARDEMLVKVMACGICGSDLVEWYRLPRAPLVQGHEIGAEVVRVGQNVTRCKPGDPVFVAPKVPCMECDLCRKGAHPICTKIKDRMPGGFAEYVLVPKELVRTGTYVLPDGISFEQATFIEPLACAARAQRLAGVSSGQKMAVLGTGISGLLHVKLAKSNGCDVAALDISEPRLAYAEAFGADETILSGQEEKLEADCVMVCTGALPAVEAAWRMVRPGGAVVFFAVPAPEKTVSIPINDFWRKEIRVLTSYYCGPTDIGESMSLLHSGRIQVEDMITDRLPLERIAEGFQKVMTGQRSLKVVIHPNG